MDECLDILHVQTPYCENCWRFPYNREPHTESQISLQSRTPHRIADFSPQSGTSHARYTAWFVIPSIGSGSKDLILIRLHVKYPSSSKHFFQKVSKQFKFQEKLQNEKSRGIKKPDCGYHKAGYKILDPSEGHMHCGVIVLG